MPPSACGETTYMALHLMVEDVDGVWQLHGLGGGRVAGHPRPRDVLGRWDLGRGGGADCAQRARLARTRYGEVLRRLFPIPNFDAE